MPFLNLNYQLMIHEDQSDKNALVRLPDITQQIQQVIVDNDKSDRLVISPNEIKDIAATVRSLQWDATTQLSFERPLASEDIIRIRWTGTGLNPVFRTARAISGSATTTVSITRVTPYVARITNVSGTAWSLGTVVNGDLLRFERSTDSFTSPLSATNLDKTWIVQSKGANYIDFIDNGQASQDTLIVLGADFGKVIRVMTQGPTKVGDTIDVSGTGINPSNLGQFDITSVSTDYIEVLNPYGVSETVLYNNITIYEFLIGFLLVRSSDRIKLRFGTQTEWVPLDRIGAKCLFLASVRTFKIQALNDGALDVEVSVQYARVM